MDNNNNNKKPVRSNGKKCVIGNCPSTQRKNPELKFHNFPKKGSSFIEVKNSFGFAEKIDRCTVWCKKVGINPQSDVSGLVVCSLHFKKDCYNLHEYEEIVHFLKKTAVPTELLDNSKDRGKVTILSTERQNRVIRRNDLRKPLDVEVETQKKLEPTATNGENCSSVSEKITSKTFSVRKLNNLKRIAIPSVNLPKIRLPPDNNIVSEKRVNKRQRLKKPVDHSTNENIYGILKIKEEKDCCNEDGMDAANFMQMTMQESNWECIYQDHAYATPMIKEEPIDEELHSEIIIKEEINDEYDRGAHVDPLLDPLYVEPAEEDPINIEETKPFKCEICGQPFIKISNLQRHTRLYCKGSMALHKSGIKCKYCKRMLRNETDLDQHIQDDCVQCGIDDRPASCEDTVNIELKLKPFNCSACHQGFSNKLSVMAHEIKAHNGEKCFRCVICELSFAEKCDLIRHNNCIHPSNKLDKFQITWKRKNNNRLLNRQHKPYTLRIDDGS